MSRQRREPFGIQPNIRPSPSVSSRESSVAASYRSRPPSSQASTPPPDEDYETEDEGSEAIVPSRSASSSLFHGTQSLVEEAHSTIAEPPKRSLKDDPDRQIQPREPVASTSSSQLVLLPAPSPTTEPLQPYKVQPIQPKLVFPTHTQRLEWARVLQELKDTSWLTTQIMHRQPTPSEREDHLLMIERTKHNLAVVAKCIVPVRKLLNVLLGLEKNGNHRIGISTAHLSSIRKLPLETMSNICLFAVFNAGVSPWTLMKISKDFRAAALRKKQIWSVINVNKGYLGKARFFDGHHICRSARELELALIRSGAVPLTIKLKECDQPMAELLVRVQPRWMDFSYDTYQAEGISKALFESELQLTRRDHPTVYSEGQPVHQPAHRPDHFFRIRINGAYDEATEPVISFVQSSKPLELSFNNHKLDLYPPTKWWSNLHVLEITNSYGYSRDEQRERKEADVIWAILDATHENLTRLTLKEVSTNFSSHLNRENPSHPLEFPQVTKMVLMGVAEWWNFSGASVTELDLKPWTMPPYPGDEFMLFPALRKLNFFARDDATRLGGVIRATNLEVLEYHNVGRAVGGFLWESQDGPQDANADFVEATFKPQVLHLHGITAAHPRLLRGLRSLTELPEIHFHSSQLKATFLKAMAEETASKNSTRKGRKNVDRLLLPGLEVMTVELAGGGGMPKGEDGKESYSQLFENILEARNVDGVEQMTSLVVKWPGEMGGGETCFMPKPIEPVTAPPIPPAVDDAAVQAEQGQPPSGSTANKPSPTNEGVVQQE